MQQHQLLMESQGKSSKNRKPVGYSKTFCKPSMSRPINNQHQQHMMQGQQMSQMNPQNINQNQMYNNCGVMYMGNNMDNNIMGQNSHHINIYNNSYGQPGNPPFPPYNNGIPYGYHNNMAFMNYPVNNWPPQAMGQPPMMGMSTSQMPNSPYIQNHQILQNQSQST